jgi:hypothetical protein
MLICTLGALLRESGSSGSSIRVQELLEKISPNPQNLMDILEHYDLWRVHALEWLENYINNTMPQAQAKKMIGIIKNFKSYQKIPYETPKSRT